jgi:hypothetical protein
VALLGEFDVCRAGNVLGEITAVPDLDPRITRVVQHQCGDANGRQDIADVDREVHPRQICRRARGHRIAEQRRQSLDLLVSPARARFARGRLETLRTVRQVRAYVGDCLQGLCLLLAPRIVEGPRRLGHCAPEDERPGAVGVGRREEGAHRTAFRQPDHGCPFGAHCIHDGADIVHSGLQRRRRRDGVGHARAPLVEVDDAGECGEALVPGP